MRHDSRYTRVRGLITDPVIPRIDGSGPRLCHGCQRSVAHADGFLQLLRRRLERLARYPANRPDSIPRCPHHPEARVYEFRREDRTIWRCSQCRLEFTKTSGTRHANHKIPVVIRETIERIVATDEHGAIARAAREAGVNYRTAWAIARKRKS